MKRKQGGELIVILYRNGYALCEDLGHEIFNHEILWRYYEDKSVHDQLKKKKVPTKWWWKYRAKYTFVERLDEMVDDDVYEMMEELKVERPDSWFGMTKLEFIMSFCMFVFFLYWVIDNV